MNPQPVRKWWVLIAMASSISTIFLDQTILPVSLPTIQRELGIPAIGLQWIINSYLLVLTTLLLAGGRLGDIFGHRRIFCIGLLIFAASSALCSLSFSGAWLIFSRSIQGIGGALLIPSTSAILYSAFPKNERGKALGIYVSIGSVFLALGPTIGGFFTQYLSWRYIFWINLPIAAIGLLMTMIFVPRSNKKRESFDILGLITFGIGIVALILGLMQAKNWGWSSAATILLILFGIGMIIWFFTADRFQRDPLIDFSLFKNKNFLGALLCICCVSFLIMTTVFWVMYFQEILHYSPSESGLLSLISNAPVMVFAPLGGVLVDKYGPKLPVVTGFLLVIFSSLWFAFYPISNNVLLLLPVLIPFGAGIPMVLSPSFVALMYEVPPQKRGITSAFYNTSRQFATTLGLAVIGSLFIHIHYNDLAKALSANPETRSFDLNEFEGLLAKCPSAIQAYQNLSEHTAGIVMESFKQTYITAFSYINLFAALIGVVGLFFAIFYLKRKLDRRGKHLVSAE